MADDAEMAVQEISSALLRLELIASADRGTLIPLGWDIEALESRLRSLRIAAKLEHGRKLRLETVAHG